MPASKRKRVVVVYSHCTTCSEAMDQLACGVDWHAVYMSRRFKDFMMDTGRLPTPEELKEMQESTGSDPCDDCCCGACGSRKETPGEECC